MRGNAGVRAAHLHINARIGELCFWLQWVCHRWLCCWSLQRHLLCLQALQHCCALRRAALAGWGLPQSPFWSVLWTCDWTLVAQIPASPQTEISFLHQIHSAVRDHHCPSQKLEVQGFCW